MNDFPKPPGHAPGGLVFRAPRAAHNIVHPAGVRIEGTNATRGKAWMGCNHFYISYLLPAIESESPGLVSNS